MAIQWEKCCHQRVLVWRTRPSNLRFADQLICVNCEHVHRVEQWYAPLAWSKRSDCTNCGSPDMDGDRCARCGYTRAKSDKLHNKLIALDPNKDPLNAAESAFELGRNVLAIKLATVALHRDPSLVQARLIRLRVMERIGFITPALDQAWQWVDQGAPPEVWGVIANLEAAQGNLDGALFALERGVKASPNNRQLWIEYAELLGHADNRPLAIQAAYRALRAPKVRERALHVIAVMAERYLRENNLTETVKALQMAGQYQHDNVKTAWLRACVAEATHQPAECHRWLDIVLALDPNHRKAKRLKEHTHTNPGSQLRKIVPPTVRKTNSSPKR